MDNISLEKKFQVFISSTYNDLFDSRKIVIDVLLSTSNCIPSGMESFPAEDDEQFNVIKKVIDMCDFYILIIGHRYGSINLNTGLSFTEMEYEYAISKKIPVLVFVLDEQIAKSKEPKENDVSYARFVLFRNKVMKNRLVATWKDNNELGQRVLTSIMNAQRIYNPPGWIRGDNYFEATNCIVFPDKKAYLHNLIEENIKDNIAAKIQIICYGASLYGHIIEEIFQLFPNFTAEVVAYSPFSEFLGQEDDRRFLDDSLERMSRYKNIQLYLSNVLPTIRASLILDINNKPTFCTMQSYYIYNDPFALVRGDGYTPSIVATKDNLIFLNKMKDIFTAEFIRLKGDNPVIVDNKNIQYEINKRRKNKLGL